MTQARFRELLRELLDENPFAIRPFLKVAGVRFTEETPTMAVTCAAAPELLVNLAFVEAHCHGDSEVKAVILHEFLHVLLRHTEHRGPVGPEEHLATDAVINAIIHRQLGPELSAMMSRYYAEAEGLMRILRPPWPGELPPADRQSAGVLPAGIRQDLFMTAWKALYEGKLVVDDIRELARSMGGASEGGGIVLDSLLGNHCGPFGEISGVLSEALGKTLRAMNGGGIWRAPKDRGVGIPTCDTAVTGLDASMRVWERRTLDVLRRSLTADRDSRRTETMSVRSELPVLGPGDRRAFSRALWSPMLPTSSWELSAERRAGTAQVYLDVSGSMNEVMPLVIGLLNRVRKFIRMPFWAFSDQVVQARIVKGKLLTGTTGGTSLSCVLEHICRTRPAAAVIVTDGYIERVDPSLVLSAGASRIHAIVTRSGSTAELERAHIAYTQLPEVPR